MKKKQENKISLGFTSQQFEPGVHICQIYNNDNERRDAIVNFIISGLKTGENTACFSENESESTLAEFFKQQGIDYHEVINSGDFSISKTAEVYFENGKFDPEKMLNLLQEFYEKSVTNSRSGARVIGEMTSEIEHIEGGTRLMEYESKVSLLVKKYPVNAVCQYDARSFDGSTILDVLKVHPYMIVRNNIVHNPFFEKPEDYLANHNCL